MPPFDKHGNLPVGDYWPTTDDFEQRFVNVVGSKTRRPIYAGYLDHRKELMMSGVAANARVLLNGSYTTAKPDPKDIDMVVEVDHSVCTDPQVMQLLAGPKTPAKYMCDAYAIAVYPDGHPYHSKATAGARAYWHKWFARDRTGRAKGLVWAKVKGLK